ncbi:hypothetical protein PFISCL1PPCAC_16845, partial [Pristionchus fissidentatus]
RKGNAQGKMLQEAATVKKATHANVVRLFGFIVATTSQRPVPHCYICMERMHANLDEAKQVVHDQAKQTATRIESFLGCVTVSVIDALVYLRDHARIMHRDLKPNNIMINEKGEVKLCDFGESKMLTGLTNTRAGTAGRGCVFYMAPERFDPNRFAQKGK